MPKWLFKVIIFLTILFRSMKGNVMAVNYNPLWHLLIEKGMKKKDLRELTGLSTNTIAKLGKNQDVSTSIIAKICTALDCKVEDVMELVPLQEKE